MSDIRLLWSRDQRIQRQFSDSQVELGQSSLMKEFVPFSLFPPTYVHDISFWTTEQMTEQQFFQDIYETTQRFVIFGLLNAIMMQNWTKLVTVTAWCTAHVTDH